MKPAISETRQRGRLVIQLFGGMRVQVDGSLLCGLHSRKGSFLLALLALHGNRELDRAWLAGVLWPESTESRALFNLRQCLADLRRSLGAEASHIKSPTSRTLMLDLSGIVCDVAAFDSAFAQSDPSLLSEAVDLYSGPLLEGCMEEWVISERASRELKLIDTLDRLSRVAIDFGDHGEAVSRLRRIIALEPLRESAWRTLMHELAASGDDSAAAEAYRDLRARLRRELNVEPDGQTTELYQSILDRVRRRPERVKPQPAPPRVSPKRIPRPLTPLIGREAEMRAVTSRVLSNRLLTLTGPGGVGKTRLAVHTAEQMCAVFRDGVCFVELAALSDSELVAPSIRVALGIWDDPGRSITDLLAETLDRADFLLVLDNCEHLLEACSTLAVALLAACPGLHIMTTSREPLGIPGESIYHVPTLSVPQAGRDLSSERLLEYDAIRLFVERTAASRTGFEFTDANAPAICRICRRLDGIALAIELAAARASTLAIEQLADRLDDCLIILEPGLNTTVPRHKTLRATIDWSYELLSQEQKRLLRLLSVFSGGCSLDAAEAVCTGDGLEELDVINDLGALVNKNLVAFVEQDSCGRYRLLESVNQFAGEQLHALSEGGAARDRHLLHFLRAAEKAHAHGYGPEEVVTLSQFDRDRDNFLAALDWSLARRTQESRRDTPQQEAVPPLDSLVSLRLCASLWLYWMLSGDAERGIQRCNLALESTESCFPGLRAQIHAGIAFMSLYCHDFEAMLRASAKSIELARKSADRETLAFALALQAMAMRNLNDLKCAIQTARDSLRISREIRASWISAFALHILGLAEYSKQNLEEAEDLLLESLELYREFGGGIGAAYDLSKLADIDRLKGRQEEAAARYREALTVFAASKERRGVAECLLGIGVIETAQGHWSRAASVFATAEAMRQTIGSTLDVVYCPEYFECVSRVRAELGEETFALMQEKGRALTLNEAVAHALA